MNRETKIRSGRILFPVILLLAIVGVQVRAQTPTPQSLSEPAQNVAGKLLLIGFTSYCLIVLTNFP